jgi:hypothetical protein
LNAEEIAHAILMHMFVTMSIIVVFMQFLLMLCYDMM